MTRRFGGPWRIPIDPDLDDEERRVAAELAELVQDEERCLAAYHSLPGTYGGRIVNIDCFRELSPAFAAADRAGEDRRRARTRWTRATYEPAKAASLWAVRRSMTTVASAVVLGGGPASGKTTAVGAILPDSDVIYDTSLASERGYALLCDMLRRGIETTVLWILRPFADALRSMIDRAVVDGRYLSLARMVALHRHSRRLLCERAGELRKAFPGMTLRIIDNSCSVRGPVEIELASLPSKGDWFSGIDHAHASHILAEAEAAGLPRDLARAIRGQG